MEWYFKAIGSNYANFSGRSTRQEYWMFGLFDILIMIFLYLIDDSSLLYTIYTLAFIIPRYALLVRRLHDINKSGWASLIALIPIVGWVIVLVFTCLESDPSDNQYGENIQNKNAEELLNKVLLVLKDEDDKIEKDEEIINVEPNNHEVDNNDLESINLKVKTGPRSGSFYTVHSNSRIGRAPDNDIVLTENTVSSYHAEIKIDNNKFIIIDLNSTNGTKVNGQKITNTEIRSGSTLKIGDVSLIVQ